MTFFHRFLLALGLCSATSCGDDGGSSDGWNSKLEVKLADGTVQGDSTGDSVHFLAIPYAKPPVGALRWKAPVKPEPWKGARHQEDFGSACPQAKSMQGPGSTNEDCLYLNVWAPDPKPAKAPVMVWIHGGGNFAGSAGDKVPDPVAATGAPAWYDGTVFAEKQGVVMVSMNYRLAPFGFFSHPALAAEGSPPANVGLLDQNMALKWVRDNISAFGGDPENVTIFGESAGSADVCFHVISPKSRGLFQRAISESGGCTTTPRGQRNPTLADTAEGMRKFASALGCEGDAPLPCLRGKSVSEILGKAMQPDPSGGFFGEADYTFEAIVDGADGFVPDAPQKLFERGEFAKVPYLLGSNNDEGSLFTALTPLSGEADYRSKLAAGYGADADRVFEMYSPAKYNNDVTSAYSRVLGDSSLVCGTHELARKVSAAGVPVYMYNFNIPWSVGFGILGVAHSSEISHVFGSPYMAASTQSVSDAMNTMWASFARNADPNFAGSPASWPRFAPSASDDDKRLQLDADYEVVDNFRKEECAMWRDIYGD